MKGTVTMSRRSRLIKCEFDRVRPVMWRRGRLLGSRASTPVANPKALECVVFLLSFICGDESTVRCDNISKSGSQRLKFGKIVGADRNRELRARRICYVLVPVILV